jgi:excinuclease ABC subunit A
VIRNADWILDLGPEGGEDGGRIVGQGRPAKIADTPGSFTGQFLKRYYTSSSGRLAPSEPDDDSMNVDSAAMQDLPFTTPQLVVEPATRKRTSAKKISQQASAPRRKKTELP